MNAHQHKEAFALMWYACDNCGHRECIWNSRDGVTPYAMGCPSCGGDCRHADWHLDNYAPRHALHYGQKFWRDGTPDEAEAIILNRLTRMFPPRAIIPAQRIDELISKARGGEDGEFRKGWPMLDVYKGIVG